MSTEYIFKYHHLAVEKIDTGYLQVDSLSVGNLAVSLPPVLSQVKSASSPDRFYGQVVLASGVAVVATTRVDPGDVINLTLVRASTTGSVLGVQVTSIAPGVAFHIGASVASAGVAATGSYMVNWSLFKTT
jgi:hypothetical protein